MKPIVTARPSTWLMALLLVTMHVGLPARLSGQCGGWLPGPGPAGVDNTVYALTPWDPDGSGPASGVLVAGGQFYVAGRVVAPGVAMYDPVTAQWAALGSLPGPVYGLAATPGGGLFAWGSVVGTPTRQDFVARWDGQAWQPLPLPPTAVRAVIAMVARPQGDVVVAVDPVTQSGWPQIARWNGSSWDGLGTTNGTVSCLAVYPNGDVVAGGNFGSLSGIGGGIAASGIARFNGSAWSALGAGIDPGFNHLSPGPARMTVLPNGDLIVAGQFSIAGTVQANGLARWNGTEWFPLNFGPGATIRAFGVGAAGESLLIRTWDLAPWPQPIEVLKWTDGQWSTVATATVEFINPLAIAALPDGEPVAGGSWNYVSGSQPSSQNIARFDGTAWQPLGTGLAGYGATDMAVWPNGDVVVNVPFVGHGITPLANAASFDGVDWSSTLPPVPGVNRYIDTLEIAADGSVLASVGQVGVGGRSVYRWNGTVWEATEIPAGSPALASLFADAHGSVYLVAHFANGGFPTTYTPWIARWDGSAWSPLGGLLQPQQSIAGLVNMPNGHLVFGGRLYQMGSSTVYNLAGWTGTDWAWPGMAPIGIVSALALSPSGELIVAAEGRVSRWSGTAWVPMGGLFNSEVKRISFAPTGELVAAGSFTEVAGVPVRGIAKWNGTVWASLVGDLSFYQWNTLGLTRVNDMRVLPNGELAVSGSFSMAGGQPSYGFARYSFTGRPAISRAPTPAAANVGRTLRLSVRPSTGYANVAVRWYRDGQPIVDGHGGASSGGGTVSGALTTLPSPTDGTRAELIIDEVRRSDAGQYTAVLESPCGSVTTEPVAVTVNCLSNYNEDEVQTLDDLADFITDFYTDPPIPGGSQPLAPNLASQSVGFGVPCDAAADAVAPYLPDAYRSAGYRVAFSPTDPTHAPKTRGNPSPTLTTSTTSSRCTTRSSCTGVERAG
jgi:hypothetical protein